MTRVTFYFNAPAKPDAARKLATKAFAGGGKVLVYTRDETLARELDMAFWTAQQLSFLPHVRCGHPLARQTPVLIGDSADELASPDVLISLEDEPPEFFSRFGRMLEIVATAPEDRDRARARYRRYKAAGHEVDSHDLAEKP